MSGPVISHVVQKIEFHTAQMFRCGSDYCRRRHAAQLATHAARWLTKTSQHDQSWDRIYALLCLALSNMCDVNFDVFVISDAKRPPLRYVDAILADALEKFRLQMLLPTEWLSALRSALDELATTL